MAYARRGRRRRGLRGNGRGHLRRGCGGGLTGGFTRRTGRQRGGLGLDRSRRAIGGVDHDGCFRLGRRLGHRGCGRCGTGRGRSRCSRRAGSRSRRSGHDHRSGHRARGSRRRSGRRRRCAGHGRCVMRRQHGGVPGRLLEPVHHPQRRRHQRDVDADQPEPAALVRRLGRQDLAGILHLAGGPQRRRDALVAVTIEPGVGVQGGHDKGGRQQPQEEHEGAAVGVIEDEFADAEDQQRQPEQRAHIGQGPAPHLAVDQPVEGAAIRRPVPGRSGSAVGVKTHEVAQVVVLPARADDGAVELGGRAGGERVGGGGGHRWMLDESTKSNSPWPQCHAQSAVDATNLQLPDAGARPQALR